MYPAVTQLSTRTAELVRELRLRAESVRHVRRRAVAGGRTRRPLAARAGDSTARGLRC